MQVSTLAEALANSRREDGTFSLQAMATWLSRDGLDELVRAAMSLARRTGPEVADDTESDPMHPWF